MVALYDFRNTTTKPSIYDFNEMLQLIYLFKDEEHKHEKLFYF